MAAKKAQHEYVLAQAIGILLPAPYGSTLWWPWLKNYHGEKGVNYKRSYGYAKYIWIDQDLKKQITGK
jgi:peptide/nickel transport system substrate-binding protein